MKLTPLLDGYRFKSPVDTAWLPDGGRLYVAELDGRIQLADVKTREVVTALDVAATMPNARFVGFALHPSKPFAYVNFDHWKPPFYSEVHRYAVHADGTLDPASRAVLFRVDRPSEYHGIGALRFGPDGLLYVGHGDGGTGQIYDPMSEFGSIFRLDVDGGEPYEIPPDNPYAGGGGRPEIYAGGFRNPWRFEFDRETGELWSGDVGDVGFEEINRVERGKDYGWPTLEAYTCMKPRDGCDPTGKVPPFYAYGHAANGASISSGFVYRGSKLPDLRGRLVYGDYITGRIFALSRPSEGPPVRAELLNASGLRPATVAFSQDPSGEIYAVDIGGGQILGLEPGASVFVDTIPKKLSETGCFDRDAGLAPSAALVPYRVNVELWSDDADKERYFAIPDGSTIDVDEDGKLLLPEGSVLVKTFSILGKKIETRLLFHEPGRSWAAYSYAWNEDETEALRVEDPTDVTAADGQTWTIPGAQQCYRCHNSVSRIVLGLELAQLDGPGFDGADQIADLERLGYLNVAGATKRRETLPAMDGPASPEARARAYLHANCSYCHRANGSTPSLMDLRYGEPFNQIYGCAKALSVPGLEDGHLLVPGDPARSAIYARMTMHNAYRMPPLGTKRDNAAAMGVIGQWIGGLTHCE